MLPSSPSLAQHAKFLRSFRNVFIPLGRVHLTLIPPQLFRDPYDGQTAVSRARKLPRILITANYPRLAQYVLAPLGVTRVHKKGAEGRKTEGARPRGQRDFEAATDTFISKRLPPRCACRQPEIYLAA